MSQTDKLLTEISGKLDKMLKLLAVDAVKGIEKEQDKIDLLDSLGFRPVEIARFLNKDINNVTAQLSNIRKKRESKTMGSKPTDQTKTVEKHIEDTTNEAQTTLLTPEKDDQK